MEFIVRVLVGAALLLTSLSADAYEVGDWRCGWKYSKAWTKGITYHWKYEYAYEGAFEDCMRKRYGNTNEFCEEAIRCRRVDHSDD